MAKPVTVLHYKWPEAELPARLSEALSGGYSLLHMDKDGLDRDTGSRIWHCFLTK